MEILEAIRNRRSIRKFKPDPIPADILQQILKAATLAPSGKNWQPWRFIVVEGEPQRAEMLQTMRVGIDKMKAQGESTGSSEGTLKIMGEAPVTIFILNKQGKHPGESRTVRRAMLDQVNVQSVSAAIQNMLLAAYSLGVGSLWICDIYYAYEELLDWLGESDQLVAAVSLGYADENPDARPRKPIEEVTTWKS